MVKILFLFLYCVKLTYGHSAIVENVPQMIEQINALETNMNLANEEQKVSGSDRKGLTKKPIKKILLPPLAFSYNKLKEDSVPASTDDKKDASEEHDQGGGKESHTDHQSESGKKVAKKNESDDVHGKKETGNHSKEEHQGHYDDEGKKEKKHFEKGGYQEEHDKSNEQEKNSKFEEDGEHNKGHSTKGGQSLKKQEHYEKKIEFYDEFFDEGSEEDFFEFLKENDFKDGSDEKASHNVFADESIEYGKKSSDEKQSYYDDSKGHKKKTGHNKHYEYIEKFGKDYEGESGKAWGDASGRKKKEKPGHKEDESRLTENTDTLPSYSTTQFQHYRKPESYTNKKNNYVDINKIKQQYKKSSNAFEALEGLIQSLENDFSFINDGTSNKTEHIKTVNGLNAVSIENSQVRSEPNKPKTQHFFSKNKNINTRNDNLSSSNKFVNVTNKNVKASEEKRQVKDVLKKSIKCRCIKTTCDEA